MRYTIDIGEVLAVKKRRISLLIVLCFTIGVLFGCGKAPVPPTAADCGVIEGVLMHTSPTKYSYSEIDGVVTTKNALFVPAGTVVASEQDIAVYPYDEYGTLSTAVLQETGQNVIAGYMITMTAGSVTVPQDAYIRIVVRGTLEGVTVTYPEDRSAEAFVFDAEYEAYQKDHDRILPLINKAEKDAVNYIFITDVHNDRNNNSQKQQESLKKQMEAVVKLANESDAIDFVVVGGDHTSGMYADKNTSIQHTNDVLAKLKDCTKPVFVLMGNHDDNSYSVPKQPYTETDVARLVSKAQWNKDVLQVFSPAEIVHDSKNADSVYYYYDLADKKTRVVCLDAIDYAQQVDENDNILLSSLETTAEGNTVTGRSQWGYSTRQLQWLAEEVLIADKGWNYVFLSHMNVQSSYRCGSELKALLTAFDARTTYTDDTIGTFDFSNATGRIMVYHYGHTHVENTEQDTALGLWRISTSSANIAQLSNNNKGKDGYRAFGTDTESCFDVMSVTEKTVWKYAFGAGTDAELPTP